MEYWIYLLVDPRDNSVRYIGYTGRPKKRLQEHIREARYGSGNRRLRWLRELANAGLEPLMELEESFDSEDVARKEVAYIKIARLLNWRLTNGTSGGDGVRNPSPEVRAKRSKALLGKPFTETHKAAIRNRKISDRGRKQLSEAAKRRVANDPERHLALLEKARRAKNQRT